MSEENIPETDNLSASVSVHSNQDGLKKDLSDLETNEQHVIDIPQKPASAYIAVCIFCLMVAFGGFISGWDTGTIGGFLACLLYTSRCV